MNDGALVELFPDVIVPGSRSNGLERACETVEGWRNVGEVLGQAGRSLMWQIGTWWNLGTAYGERVKIVTAADWTGPTHGTCREAGRVAARWAVSRRTDRLGYEHHKIVTALPDERAIPLLAWAAEPAAPRSTRELAARVKQVRREEREAALGERIESASVEIGHQLYGVIMADPPWRFEPFSRESGMDRAADNHYPTMDIDAICALDVPAAENAGLYLWATAPMLLDACDVMDAWGFEYRSHLVWAKDRAGTGYWARNRHELLLIGTRGHFPAPAPGTQPESVITAPVARHSEKPAVFADLLDAMFPHLPKLEMFARRGRAGWDTWGAEAEYPRSDR